MITQLVLHSKTVIYSCRWLLDRPQMQKTEIFKTFRRSVCYTKLLEDLYVTVFAQKLGLLGQQATWLTPCHQHPSITIVPNWSFGWRWLSILFLLKTQRFSRGRTPDYFFHHLKFHLGSGCGAVGRAFASDTRRLGFKSSHQQLLLNIYLLLTAFRKDEIKKKMPGMAPQKQVKLLFIQ